MLTGTAEGLLAFRQENFEVAPEEVPLEPKYLLAVASDAELPAIPASVLEENREYGEAARLTRLLDDVVVQLKAVIVDRDAYKAAVEAGLAGPPADLSAEIADQKRAIALLQETVNSVIVERDAYRAAVETWSAAHDDQKRAVALLQETVGNLIVERDAYRAALAGLEGR